MPKISIVKVKITLRNINKQFFFFWKIKNGDFKHEIWIV